MSKETLKLFFNDLDEKEGLKQGLIDCCGKPETKEEGAKLFAGYAKKKGYDVSEQEFLEFFIESDSNVKGKSDADAGKIQALKDEELAAVAGGKKKDNDNCRNTYVQYENCVWTDECTHINNEYSNNKGCRASFRDKENCALVDKCNKIVCDDY